MLHKFTTRVFPSKGYHTNLFNQALRTATDITKLTTKDIDPLSVDFLEIKHQRNGALTGVKISHSTNTLSFRNGPLTLKRIDGIGFLEPLFYMHKNDVMIRGVNVNFHDMSLEQITHTLNAVGFNYTDMLSELILVRQISDIESKLRDDLGISITEDNQKLPSVTNF